MSDKTEVASFTNQDVFHFSKKTLYKGFFSLFEYQFQYKKFDGSISRMVQREMLERKDAVIVLAYDPKLDCVVLIEQIRIGAFEKSTTPWMLELVAGMIDKEGESIFDVAERESLEEAGMHISHLKRVLSYFASPGGTTEKLHIVIGQVDASTVSGIHGLEEEEEDIRVHVVKRAQAYEWIASGKIDNAGTIIALQWLQLNHAHLSQEWKA